MTPNGETLWVYLTLISGTFLAWIPLTGPSLPVADDFALIRIVGEGGIFGYLHSLGLYRPLGHYLPIWLFLQNPSYHPIAVLLTHVLATILLFHVCQSLFGGIRLPLLAALVFGMFPFGYQAQTWIVAYNFVIPVTFLLANILLLARYKALNWPIPLVFLVSAALSLLMNLGNESLFFASAFSGLFAYIEAPTWNIRVRWLLSGKALLGLAPVAGCIAWLEMYYAFLGSDIPKQITVINLDSILSTYYYQYSLLDVFVPWLSSDTRQFAFFGWSKTTVVAVTMCFILFFWGLGRLSLLEEDTVGFREASSHKLLAILALLFGASLIYAVAGGFSLESRKKYPLIPLLLLLGCWLWRATFQKRPVPAPAFLTYVGIMCIAAAVTTWLVVGIWKYETARYSTLAEFISKNGVHGDLRVIWNPDLNRSWPQMRRSMGYRFDDAWVLNLAVKSRGGDTISDSASDKATVVEYDPGASSWVLFKR